ncbi:MAG TPA: SDR family oxidoreductase [Verrucomicrobiae bacterium]|nr:SDR family oxidoreductase [Verrucomicrobiae bacterium]
MTSRFRERVVVVTGGSSGIGRETALAFARVGARVVLASRDVARLGGLVDAHPDLRDRLLAVPADVTKQEDVERLFGTVTARFGRVDILVNNAGIGLRAAVAETRFEDARRVMEVNFFGVLRCIQAALPTMKHQPPASPRGPRAQIVNVGSVLSALATPFNGLYSASKFALRALSDSLRIELKRDAIDVILIMPGYTDTPFFDNLIRYAGPPRTTSIKGQHPSRVARAILDACDRRKREVVLTAPGMLGVWMKRWLPGVLDRALARTRHNP